MSKSLSRHRKMKRERDERLAVYLTRLLTVDPKRFFVEWQKRERSWVEQIHHRGRSLQKKSKREDSHTRIFAIYDQADSFLSSHPEINQLVGTSTRDLLRTECQKAFAKAIDPRLAKLVSRMKLR